LELVSDVCSVASENQAKTWTPSHNTTDEEQYRRAPLTTDTIAQAL